MPVWHEAIRKYGDAVGVVGIVQEQHPDRARLFAQWEHLDFPILWDPFNLTGSMVVPSFVALDEEGIVRSVSFDEKLLDDFVRSKAPPASAGDREAGAEPSGRLPQLDLLEPGTPEHARFKAISDYLAAPRVEGAAGLDGLVVVLDGLSTKYPEDAALAFQAGVAHRLRYDSSAARGDDFQLAIDGWTRALALDPNQYIWRRRIQQYGPRMDKPYDFYSWIDEAREEIVARGDDPIRLAAQLSPAELAESRAGAADAAAGAEPDPAGEILRDDGELVAVEQAVAFQTSGEALLASVHLTLRPDAERDVHWSNEAGPLVVWVDGGSTAEGWTLDRSLFTKHGRFSKTSDEVRTLAFDVKLEEAAQAVTIPGYALYYVCEGESGECLYLRRDFDVTVRVPPGR